MINGKNHIKKKKSMVRKEIRILCHNNSIFTVYLDKRFFVYFLL